jgi:hypothetical protein
MKNDAAAVRQGRILPRLRVRKPAGDRFSQIILNFAASWTLLGPVSGTAGRITGVDPTVALRLIRSANACVYGALPTLNS